MELKRALKSLVALGTGATLVGATVLSALAAADLSTYPAPFVKDGTYDALIVVGASAKTADVLGAVDIATSLQAANTVSKAVPGSATTTTVEGDAFRIDSGADFLEKGELLDSVGVTTLTDTDLAALADGKITNAKGTFVYKQTLTVGNGSIVFAVDPDDSTDTPAWYYKILSDDPVYTYKVTFLPALESDVDSENDLDDIDKKVFTFLGKDYSVVDTDCDDTLRSCQIDFMAGAASDTLNVGETKTYTVGTTDYEVELTFVTGTTSSTYAAKFTVNGVSTAQLLIGETDVLADGTEIGVADVLYQAYAGGVQSAEFFIGATKIRIKETAFDAGTGTTSVIVGSNTVTDVIGNMKGTNATATTTQKIDFIQFKWTADEDIYIPAGGKLSETAYNDDNQMFLNFDIEYQGLKEDTDMDVIELVSSGDDEYRLHFTNKAGNVLKVPLYDVDALVLRHGKDPSYALRVAEGSATGAGVNWSSSDVIARNDYFVISDSASKNTYLIRYKSLDSSNAVIEFEDVGSGTEVTMSYSFVDNETKAGDLTMGGTDYRVWIAKNANNVDILVDLDASGGLTKDTKPTWYTKFGARIDPNAAPSATVNAGFNISAEAGDDTVGQTAPTDTISVAITNDTADTLEIGTVGGNITLLTIGDSNNKEDWSVWGTHVYQTYAESGPDKLTLTYPDDQTEHLVYYTSGATTSSTTSGGTTYNEVVAIDVGAAVLDTEVADFSAQNIIIVGGPCVNLAAADVLESGDDCTEGFTEGEAKIQLFERANGNVALLVAGFSALDTRRAARALGEFGSNALEGTEMVVTGTSLTEYTVTKVVVE